MIRRQVQTVTPIQHVDSCIHQPTDEFQRSGLCCGNRLHFVIQFKLAPMTLLWIAVAFSGAIFGFAAARAAKPTGKRARSMAWAFALLLGCFLVAPLIRLPLRHVLDSPSSWRLFEVYSYGSVFAIALFSSSLLYLLGRAIKLRSSGSSSRDGS